MPDMSYGRFVSGMEELVVRADQPGDFDELPRAAPSISLFSSLRQAVATTHEDRRAAQKAKDTPVPESIEASHVSMFSLLGGGAEQLFNMAILPCLAPHELAQLSATCRYLRHVCHQPSLWEHMYKRDFIPQGELIGGRARSYAEMRSASQLASNPHNMYVARYKDYLIRVSRSKDEALDMEREMRRSMWASKMEHMLDWTQMRMPGPVLLCSLFLSIILFCQKVDGLCIPYWACAAPLALSCVYVLLCLWILVVVEKRDVAASSIFWNLWPHVRGPFVIVYKAIGRNARLLRLAVGTVLLVLVQLGLLVVKLSLYIPLSFRDDLTWGMVFIPTWMLFALFLAMPCLGARVELPEYAAILFLLWIPFLALFACLTVKLDYNNEGKGSIRMVYILSPFFVLEGFMMLWALVAYVVALIRYRRGLLDRIEDYVTLVLLTWGWFSPLVTFQSLLCARDDHQLRGEGSGPSATEIISPVLVLLGSLVILVVFASATHRTAFESRRANAVAESAGLRVIHTF